MLVGCKKDKEHLREVSYNDAQQFADYHNLLYVETSSKTGYNVENAFKLIASEISKKLDEGKFKLQDGWDGIKSGYLKPQQQQQQIQPQLYLNEQNDDFKENKRGCC